MADFRPPNALAQLETSRDFAAITPNDGADFDTIECRAVYVGGAGNITATNASGVDVLFSNVLAGTVMPIRTRRIKATGTTATGLVALP